MVGTVVGAAVRTVVGTAVRTGVGAAVRTGVGAVVGTAVGAVVRPAVGVGRVRGQVRVDVRALLGHVPVLVDDVAVGELALVLRTELVARRHVRVDVAAHRLDVGVGTAVGAGVRTPVGARIGTPVGAPVGAAVRPPIGFPVPGFDVAILVLPLRAGVPRPVPLVLAAAGRSVTRVVA
ncbi:MAG TPA: hypothetical protein VE547_04950, partial [Mycobacteriales bacterium]|nr:hypothetical protein [Mycobacteriales bacterium]